MTQSKFYYITKRDLDKLSQLFSAQDPKLNLVLNEYGNYSDIAVYSPKYQTVVFTTVKSDTVKNRM